jgi:hypothetical protein
VKDEEECGAKNKGNEIYLHVISSFDLYTFICQEARQSLTVAYFLLLGFGTRSRNKLFRWNKTADRDSTGLVSATQSPSHVGCKPWLPSLRLSGADTDSVSIAPIRNMSLTSPDNNTPISGRGAN